MHIRGGLHTRGVIVVLEEHPVTTLIHEIRRGAIRVYRGKVAGVEHTFMQHDAIMKRVACGFCSRGGRRDSCNG